MTTELHRIEKSATAGQGETLSSSAVTEESGSSYGWRCNVHGFYYMWYRSKERDGAWVHWNHRRLPHWDPQTAKNLHMPYSSLDPQVIASHMEMMKRAGIGVVVVGWYWRHWPIDDRIDAHPNTRGKRLIYETLFGLITPTTLGLQAVQLLRCLDMPRRTANRIAHLLEHETPSVVYGRLTSAQKAL
ncbi:hypothetical protein FOZ63_007296, partial [Perkinsus olseni]